MTGPAVQRVTEVGAQARAFVETMKAAGAREDELATVLFAVLEELEREAKDAAEARRRKRHGYRQEAQEGGGDQGRNAN